MIKCKSMEENRYKIPEDKAMVGMAAEQTPAVRASLSVQEMRHCLIDAIYSSKDIDKLHTCLVILNSKSNNEYQSKYRTKTDEELAAELSQFPSWDETEHPDLSNVDYRQYKHKKSPKAIKAVSKWQ